MPKQKLTRAQLWRILNPFSYHAIMLKWYYRRRRDVNEQFSIDPNYHFQAPEVEMMKRLQEIDKTLKEYYA